MNRLQTSLKLSRLILVISLIAGLSSVALAQTKMTIAYSSIGPMATGIWMAKESGAFEKYGLQADIILITSGPVSVQSLIGGDLHAVSAASNAVINAVLSGAPIIAVGGTANRPYHRLFVQPEINRLEDLRGKSLGVTRFGSITDNLSRILLRKHGLEGAVNVRQMGGTIEVAAAFQNRLIAGAVTSELRVTPPSQAKVLVRLVDMGIPYSMNMIAVQRDYYRRNDYVSHVAALEQRVDSGASLPAERSLLGYHYLFLGHPDAARTQFDLALQLDPADALAGRLMPLAVPAVAAPAPSAIPAPANSPSRG